MAHLERVGGQEGVKVAGQAATLTSLHLYKAHRFAAAGHPRHTPPSEDEREWPRGAGKFSGIATPTALNS